MTEQQQLARGKNMMLTLLEKRLSVPKIYLDAEWQGHHADILAIDRDGSGDVHIVQAYLRPTTGGDLPARDADREHIDRLLEALSHINAQYKYVLGVGSTAHPSVSGNTLGTEFEEKTFSPDGLGRTGIAFAQPETSGAIKVDIVIFPERFRAFVGASAEDFVSTHSADWEMRA